MRKTKILFIDNPLFFNKTKVTLGVGAEEALELTLLGFKKIKRDSKGNYLLSGYLINTFGSSTSYAKNLVIKVYRNDKLIAKQTLKRWNIRVGAGSSKAITITIKKKNIKSKKADLTTGTVRVVVAGGKIY